MNTSITESSESALPRKSYFSEEEQKALQEHFIDKRTNEFMNIVILKSMVDCDKDEEFKKRRWEQLMTIAEKSYDKAIAVGLGNDELFTAINVADTMYIALTTVLPYLP